MYIWAICLLTLLFIIPVGVFLRVITDSHIDNKNKSWTKDNVELMLQVFEVNKFLFLLLFITGIIENISLFGLIISIPLFFIFGI